MKKNKKPNLKIMLLMGLMIIFCFQSALAAYREIGILSHGSYVLMSTLAVVLVLVLTAVVLYILKLRRERAYFQTEFNKSQSFQKLSDNLEKLIAAQTAELAAIQKRLEQEIVERRKAEENLERAKGYADNLIGSSIDIIISVDHDRNVIEFNRAAEMALGYTKEEVIGKPIVPLYATEEDGRQVAESLKRDGSFRGEVKNRRKNGQIFYSYLSASMMHDRAGRFVGVMGISRDITERKIAEEKLKLYATELERSNRELQQFAYVASHDLQEPLRMVTSYLQLLEKRYGAKFDGDAHDFIGFAVDGAKRMHNLINDLLAYSRVSTHAQPSQPTNCQEVLTVVLANLQAARTESRAEITHDPLPVIMFDPTQLSQLLQNLLSNAIKFRTKADVPRIHVGAATQNGDWLFSVKDNGIGIDEHNLQRIFNIFQRLHTAAEYPGTGIGLAICKKIVERHGGRIWAESEPGHGTSFYFTIPRMQAAANGPAA